MAAAAAASAAAAAAQQRADFTPLMGGQGGSAGGYGGYGAWPGTPVGMPPGSPRAARGGAHFVAAGSLAEAAALRAWKVEVDGRLDEQATAITGVGLTLTATIDHAKIAMSNIVQGVRVELMGSQAQDHALLEQLNAVVAATRAKFTEVQLVVDKVASDVVVQVAAMDRRTDYLADQLTQRTAQLEHRIAELAAQLRILAAAALHRRASWHTLGPILGPQLRRPQRGHRCHSSRCRSRCRRCCRCRRRRAGRRCFDAVFRHWFADGQGLRSRAARLPRRYPGLGQPSCPGPGSGPRGLPYLA
jgi:hypothetical protein